MPGAGASDDSPHAGRKGIPPPLQQYLVFFGKVAFTLGKIGDPPLLALLHEHLGTGCIQEDAP